MTSDIEAKSLPAHVAACGERYRQVFRRLNRIEGVLIVAAGTMIMGLFSVIWLLIKVLAKLQGLLP